MSLAAGSRLGAYEIVAPLGAGGMGEVYRARDTQLDRDVAVKLLPQAFASDPDRILRVTREARILASLNHPNIAAIHGIEGNALVMELVEGEDLSAVIGGGALAIADVLPIARQIAEALEAAHEAGIVHRDLKPANIKLREDGTVKVLDFGLAKATASERATTSGDFQNSPTFTSPVMTQLGMILGTAAYMAPEQARPRRASLRRRLRQSRAPRHRRAGSRRLPRRSPSSPPRPARHGSGRRRGRPPFRCGGSSSRRRRPSAAASVNSPFLPTGAALCSSPITGCACGI